MIRESAEKEIYAKRKMSKKHQIERKREKDASRILSSAVATIEIFEEQKWWKLEKILHLFYVNEKKKNLDKRQDFIQSQSKKKFIMKRKSQHNKFSNNKKLQNNLLHFCFVFI